MEQNTPQENINSPLQPIMPKTFDKLRAGQKKQIPTWVGFLIIVLFTVIVFGGVFVWQYFFVKLPAVVEVTKVQSKTAGWKTYTNSQYGFEFKYPESFGSFTDYKYAAGLGSHNILTGLSSNVSDGSRFFLSVMTMDEFSFSNTGGIVITYKNNRCDSSEPKYLKKNDSFIFRGSEGCYILEGDAGGGFIGYVIPDNVNNRIIEIVNNFSFSGNSESIARQNIEQILSTFKFITPTVQTTLELWPDVNSFDLANKTFQAKGVRNSAKDVQNIKVYTITSTKIYRTEYNGSGYEVAENYDFLGFYSLLKNWIGPDWWFTIKGELNSDGSINATEIFMTSQS